MRKLLLLLFISVLSFVSLKSQAQSVEEVAKEAALEICNCIEPMLKDLHPALIEYMATVAQGGEQEGESALMDYLLKNPEEQEAIMADAQKLELIDSNGQMTNCFEQVEDRMGDLEVKGEFSKEEFEGLMYDAIGNEPKCRLTNLLLLIGEKNGN